MKVSETSRRVAKQIYSYGEKHKGPIVTGALATASSSVTGMCIESGLNDGLAIAAGGSTYIILWASGNYIRRRLVSRKKSQ